MRVVRRVLVVLLLATSLLVFAPNADAGTNLCLRLTLYPDRQQVGACIPLP